MLDLKMDKRTSGAQAADALRCEILSGRIPDGAEISQVELAEGLGLSRMPIREALSALEVEGVVERLDNRRTRAIGMKCENRFSRFSLLERMTCLALSALSASAREELSVYWRDAPDTPDAHLRFHDALYKRCPDAFLRQLYRRVFRGFLEYCLQNGRGEIGKDDMASALSGVGQNANDAQSAISRYYTRVDER